MPHDKKGRLVGLGDHVRFLAFVDGAQKVTVGRVFSVNHGTDTCNAEVAHLVPGFFPVHRATVTLKETELVLKADGSEPAAGAVVDAGFGRIGAVVAMILIALGCLSAPLFAQAPSPAPPSIGQANAEPFSVATQLGGMVVTTADTGTGLTPMINVDAEGPLAIGNGHSLGRIGARLGLTSSPGQAFDGTDPSNYKGVEVGLRLGRVVGLLDTVRTVVVAEYSFTTLIKGATQARPRDGLAQAFGVGLSFQSKDASALLTVLGGFDEATTTCPATAICSGIHSGFAFLIYGQLPILDGKVLFGGDVSITGGASAGAITRTSVERVFVAADPVKVLKKQPPAAAAAPARRITANRAATFVGPDRR